LWIVGVFELGTDFGRFNGIALSFNGGKDCLVLLLLYIYILDDHHSPPLPIQTCFVTPPHSFPEIDAFVTDCASTYDLDVERIALPMKGAFARYLGSRGNVRAVLVGTRRTDPHGEYLGFFDETDHGWPPFMRVHPVINWHYWEIWDVTTPPPRFFQAVVLWGLTGQVSEGD
jgi:FAD synthetase